MLFTCITGTVLQVNPAYGAETIRIGVLAFRPKPQTLVQWQPLSVALKQSIPDHDFVIEALTFPEMEAAIASRKVDFVLTNPGHYILLTKRIGMSAPLATLSTYDNGKNFTVFGGVIFCRAGDPNITSLSDIKGKTVAVTSTDSLGGYQTQAYELNRVGIHLPQEVKLISTGMPHDNVVQAVLAGHADVGFVRTGVLEGMAHEGLLDMKQIKVINDQHLSSFPWQLSTQLYPEWPFAALPHVGENLARHVAAAIFMLEENTTALHDMGIHGFVVPSDYTVVANLLKELRLPPFDDKPQFTLKDIWERYLWQMIGGLVAISLILLLGVRLFFTSRKLEADHRVLLVQKQQLQESEAHLNAIIENEPECIKIMDKQGCLLQMNPAGLAMIEADSLEQVVGCSLLDVVLPEYRDAFLQVHRHVLAGEIMELEFEIKGLKGGHRWLKTRAVPMYHKNETVLLGVTRDITQRKEIEIAVRKSHEKMQSLLQSMAEGAYGVDANGQCTFVNKSFLKILGYDQADEIIGRQIHELIHHSHVDGSHYPVSECKMYAAFMHNVEIHCTDEVFWHKDGTAIPVEYWTRPIVIEGVTSGAITTFIDITERKNAEEALQAAALYSRSLIEASLDPLVTISVEGKITDANAASEKVTGIKRDKLIGSDFADYFTEPERAHESYRQVFSQGVVTDYPLAIRHASGKVTDVLYNATLYRNAKGEVLGVLATARDVTERKQMEEEVHQLAFYDSLTNLPNRRLLNDRLQLVLATKKRDGGYGALMFLDLDNFKPLNDKYGHVVGDLLLVEAARRLVSCIRKMDSVARFGGDEFIVILAKLDEDPSVATLQADIVAEKIRTALSEPYVFTISDEGHPDKTIEHHCTASIGVMIFNGSEGSQDDILKWADAAMYEAKDAGRNLIRFYVRTQA